uniref:LysR family transcriptional regulator n=1 Tax=Macrostomum lignano TaxID=282301 RepID=A0A1I8FEH5_9PLAT
QDEVPNLCNDSVLTQEQQQFLRLRWRDAAVGLLELTVIAMPELHAYHPNRFNSGQSAEPLHAEILAESPGPDVARRLAAMIGRRRCQGDRLSAFVGLGFAG